MTTLEMTVRLISIAAFLQGLEMLLAKKCWSEGGLWSWSILKKEYSGRLEKFLDFCLKPQGFQILMALQTALALINIFVGSHLINGFLFGTVFLTAVRWRGTFNGGSDYMTALVLAASFIAGFFAKDSLGQLACFAYIGIQSIMSYFVAGIAKIKQGSWHNGKALTQFLLHSNYLVDSTTKSLVNKPSFALMASIIILIFECTFPVVLLDLRLCLIYLCVGFLFHLENFFVLGLNRFVFAWLASYPAIYYISNYISENL